MTKEQRKQIIVKMLGAALVVILRKRQDNERS